MVSKRPETPVQGGDVVSVEHSRAVRGDVSPVPGVGRVCCRLPVTPVVAAAVERSGSPRQRVLSQQLTQFQPADTDARRDTSPVSGMHLNPTFSRLHRTPSSCITSDTLVVNHRRTCSPDREDGCITRSGRSRSPEPGATSVAVHRLARGVSPEQGQDQTVAQHSTCAAQTMRASSTKRLREKSTRESDDSRLKAAVMRAGMKLQIRTSELQPVADSLSSNGFVSIASFSGLSDYLAADLGIPILLAAVLREEAAWPPPWMKFGKVPPPRSSTSDSACGGEEDAAEPDAAPPPRSAGFPSYEAKLEGVTWHAKNGGFPTPLRDYTPTCQPMSARKSAARGQVVRNQSAQRTSTKGSLKLQRSISAGRSSIRPYAHIEDSVAPGMSCVAVVGNASAEAREARAPSAQRCRPVAGLIPRSAASPTKQDICRRHVVSAARASVVSSSAQPLESEMAATVDELRRLAATHQGRLQSATSSVQSACAPRVAVASSTETHAQTVRDSPCKHVRKLDAGCVPAIAGADPMTCALRNGDQHGPLNHRMLVEQLETLAETMASPSDCGSEADSDYDFPCQGLTPYQSARLIGLGNAIGSHRGQDKPMLDEDPPTPRQRVTRIEEGDCEGVGLAKIPAVLCASANSDASTSAPSLADSPNASSFAPTPRATRAPAPLAGLSLICGPVRTQTPSLTGSGQSGRVPAVVPGAQVLSVPASGSPLRQSLTRALPRTHPCFQREYGTTRT